MDVVEEEPHHRSSDVEHSDLDNGNALSPSLNKGERNAGVGAASLSRAVPIRLRRNTFLDEAEETEDIAQSFHVNRDRRRFSFVDNQEMVLNKQAVKVIRRVRDKLKGMDFGDKEPLGVPDQVDKLIKQATSNEALAVAFSGWCPWW